MSVPNLAYLNSRISFLLRGLNDGVIVCGEDR